MKGPGSAEANHRSRTTRNPVGEILRFGTKICKPFLHCAARSRAGAMSVHFW